MSDPERKLLHSLAAAAGKSTVRYMLDLVATDAASEGGIALAERVGVDQAVIVGIFRQTWGGAPPSETPRHAEAQHAVAAAVG